MDTLLYQKALEGQELLLEQASRSVTGTWILNGQKMSFAHLDNFSLEAYPLIKSDLAWGKKLILGFSKENQLYYAVMLNENYSSLEATSGHTIVELLSKLDVALIYKNEAKKGR